MLESLIADAPRSPICDAKTRGDKDGRDDDVHRERIKRMVEEISDGLICRGMLFLVS